VYNDQLGQFAEYLCNLLGYDKFLPSSSGVEACESACKVARRWGYEVKNVRDNEAQIVMARNNFWGRSITASGACDDPSRFKHFGPFTPGFPLVPYGDIQALENYLKFDQNVVAVMFEPIQGEGGIIIPPEGYFKQVKQVCQKYNVLMIADEVQTGFGRTGVLMGSQHDMKDCKPDIMTVAKSVSGGVTPVSGIVCDNHIMEVITPGTHGSTYGGNPLGMAVAKRAVEVLVEEKMVENSKEMGEYLIERMRQLKSPLIKEVRGRGLFVGLEFKRGLEISANDIANNLLNHGLITKATHEMTLRMSPPLTVNKKQIDEGLEILKQAIGELETLSKERMSTSSASTSSSTSRTFSLP
jgi:ornithine--oxo-acid transaminase